MLKSLIISWSIGMVLACNTLAQDIPAKFTAEGHPVDPDFFPIGVWLQQPALAPKYKAAGINHYVGLWKGPTEAQLAELKKHGMPVICPQNEVALASPDRDMIVGYMHGDEPDNAQKFTGLWKSDKAMIKKGWPEIYDKQDLDNKPYKGYGPPVPPEWTARDYKEIKEKESGKPVLLNLGQGVAWDGWHGRGERTGKLEDYPEYIKGCDIVSYDIYPANHSHKDVAGKLWYVARGIERLRQWSGGGKKPVWMVLERGGSGAYELCATPEEIKTEAWMAITEGAGGLIWFVHQFKPTFNAHALLDSPEMLAAVTAINRQIHALAPVLNSPTQEDLANVTSGAEAPINLMAKKHNGAVYLFAVGMRPRATAAHFQVKGLADATAEVLGENRTIAVTDGRFKDAFKPYGVHLYRLTEK